MTNKKSNKKKIKEKKYLEVMAKPIEPKVRIVDSTRSNNIFSKIILYLNKK
jgi:hypothetical protein